MVIEFFTAEGSSPVEIHVLLRSVCGDDTIDVNSDAGFTISRAVKKTW
jgi:hypothetical protein